MAEYYKQDNTDSTTTQHCNEERHINQWLLLIKRLTVIVFRPRTRMNAIIESSFIRDRTYTPSITTPRQMNQNTCP